MSEFHSVCDCQISYHHSNEAHPTSRHDRLQIDGCTMLLPQKHVMLAVRKRLSFEGPHIRSPLGQDCCRSQQTARSRR